MNKVLENVQVRHSVRMLTKVRYGYSLRELGSVPRRNLYQLWKWMRGPSALSMVLGLVYGAFLGSSAAVSIFASLSADSSVSQADPIALGILVVLISGMAGVGIGMGFSSWKAKSGDPFYTYGRRCLFLIVLKVFTAEKLDTRRHLARVVGQWAAEAAKMKIEVEPYKAELEAIVAKKVVKEDDLKRVSEIGRQAALAPCRGDVDMLGLTPTLMPGPFGARVGPATAKVLAYLGGIISTLLALKELLGK